MQGTILRNCSKAGIAMNEAKEGGKNRVVYYSERIPSVPDGVWIWRKICGMRPWPGMENLKYIISLLWKSTAEDDSVTCTGAEALVLEQQRAGLYSA